MNAPSFPPNPPVGARYGNWVWSGSRWVCAGTGIQIFTQIFRASAPYTPSPGLISAIVETLGAGGGGGGTIGPAGWSGGGGGGGSGAYSRLTCPAGLVAGGVNVTIGAGGAGDPGQVTGTAGLQGGATSFGSLCVANGGFGGLTWGVGSSGQGGDGAYGNGVGELVLAGNGGFGATPPLPGATTDTTMYGGRGGAPPMLGGGVPAPLSLFQTGGLMGSSLTVGPGCGGMGGLAMNGWGTADGGNGGSGLCLITEYCWSDAGDDGGCGCGPMGQARIAAPGYLPQAWGYDND